jgi:hypothetical protein
MSSPSNASSGDKPKKKTNVEKFAEALSKPPAPKSKEAKKRAILRGC